MTLQLIGQVLKDPESIRTRQSVSDNIRLSRLAYYYYENKMFNSSSNWDWYLKERRLYKHTKIYFNPLANVVDFYLDNIWTGIYNETYPNLATPVLDKTEPDIIQAIAQLDQWTRWRRTQQQIKCYAAITGSVFVEIIDDSQAQTVGQNIVWNADLKDIKLNRSEDVIGYTIEYQIDDGDGKSAVYKKIVDRDTFRTFKDDEPFAYDGIPASLPNPYGFCPAVLFKQGGIGINGTPAFTHFDKMDGINSLTSHVVGYIHKEMESGKIIGGVAVPQDVQVLSGAAKNTDGTVTETDPELDRVLLAAPGAISVHDLAGTMKTHESFSTWKELIMSFAKDYPEIEYKDILRENGAMSGIALERLLIPAQNRLDRAAANYDEQLIKMRQMQIAIAGWRTKNGWTGKSTQQAVFEPFDLDSYKAGKLNFNLKRSLLIELSESELLDMESKRFDNANKAGFYSQERQLKVSGLNDDEIKQEMAKVNAENSVTAAAQMARDNMGANNGAQFGN